MFPTSFDPRSIQKMMKQLGMDMQEIPAIEVIIKQADGSEIKIKNPQVQKMRVQGQDSFQVIGDIVSESPPTGEVQISEQDIEIVAQQTKVPKEKAKEALEKNKGDIAKSILELQCK